MTEIRENLRFDSLDLESMNRIMGRLADRLDELEGRRGDPKFYQDVDLQSKRLLNVAGMASEAVESTQAQPTTFAEKVTFNLPPNIPVIIKNAVPTTSDLPDNGAIAIWKYNISFGVYTVPSQYLVCNINGTIYRTSYNLTTM